MRSIAPSCGRAGRPEHRPLPLRCRCLPRRTFLQRRARPPQSPLPRPKLNVDNSRSCAVDVQDTNMLMDGCVYLKVPYPPSPEEYVAMKIVILGAGALGTSEWSRVRLIAPRI